MSPAVLTIWAALLFAAGADVDVSEYQTRAAPGSEKEQVRLKARIEEEARLGAERAQREAEEVGERIAAERARLEARPYPVRLTERRCTLCHHEDNFTQNAHTWLGWQVVVLRMQHLNHCPLEPGERAVIVAHLAEHYPASATMAALEWGTLPAALLAPLVAALGYHACRRRRAIGRRP